MVGTHSSLDRASWTVTPAVSVDKATAPAGSPVTWTHSVAIAGTAATRTINYYYNNVSGFSSNTLSAIQGSILTGQGPGSRTYYSSITIPSTAAVGHQYCRSTASGETSILDSGSIYSAKACVTVLAPLSNFDLTPLVELSHVGMIEAGTAVEVKPSITKTGTTTSGTVNYSLVKTITNPPNTGKTTIGSGAFATNIKTPVLGYTEKSTDYPAGTKICFVLTVTPYSHTSAASKASPSVCVTIAKKPKVQIWGGDVKVGRHFSSSSSIIDSNIQASTSVKTINSEAVPRTFGSWSEYALAAPGFIIGAASGSGLNNGLARADNLKPQCDFSTLSFSNSLVNSTCNSDDNLGKYNFTKKTIPDISSKFPVNSSTEKLSGSFTLGATTKGLYTTDTDAALTITGGTIPKNNWVVINAPSATITISGDITYAPGPFYSINEIPQLVIIAKNIYISNVATKIDSWLIAKGGIINTCAEKQTGDISQSDCDKQLVINGPVMASKLSLRRTAGSDAGVDSGKPAEILNLRADAYLWAYARASGVGRVWTVYTTNVPPRL